MNMVSMIYVFVLIVEIVKRTPLEQQVVERGACSCHAPLGFSAMVIGCLMTSSVSIVR